MQHKGLFYSKHCMVMRFIYCRGKSVVSPLSLYSLNGRKSHHKISWSLEAERSGFGLFNRSEIDGYIGSNVAGMPVKFQSATIIMTPNVATSSLHYVWL